MQPLSCLFSVLPVTFFAVLTGESVGSFSILFFGRVVDLGAAFGDAFFVGAFVLDFALGALFALALGDILDTGAVFFAVSCFFGAPGRCTF